MKRSASFIAVKKSHTVKSFLISYPNSKIGYISHAYVGTSHDYSILKTVLPSGKDWFKDFEVRLDLGYLGFDKDYCCKKAYLPHKKKPKCDLPQVEKDINKAFAKERVKVEHSIRGVKRFRILSERLRIHDYNIYNSMLGVCAGLWNFYLS